MEMAAGWRLHPVIHLTAGRALSAQVYYLPSIQTCALYYEVLVLTSEEALHTALLLRSVRLYGKLADFGNCTA